MNNKEKYINKIRGEIVELEKGSDNISEECLVSRQLAQEYYESGISKLLDKLYTEHQARMGAEKKIEGYEYEYELNDVEDFIKSQKSNTNMGKTIEACFLILLNQLKERLK